MSRSALRIAAFVWSQHCGSRGKPFGSAEAFNKHLRPLAASLSAAIGATHAAVDAGYAPFEYQTGQTGKVITPKLYIAFGISGSDHQDNSSC
ncbi:MAG: FAD-binding protein [Candidatus Hodgkinia cicadicola]|nr:MAG: FAD-binding protein [Candidatus Hodgkinia cicadicola]